MTPLERVLIWTSIILETIGAVFLAAPLTWSMFTIALVAGCTLCHELLEQRGPNATIAGLILGVSLGVFFAAAGQA